MTAGPVNESAAVLADPSAYTDEQRLHASLTKLRADAPISLVDAPSYRPFWAITKHADILEIERANELFINAPLPVLMPIESEDRQAQTGVRTLIHADDPEHQVMRSVGANWFRPKAMRALQNRVDELAKTYVDKMRNCGGSCDFARDIAVDYPLFVMMSLLGLPESDFPQMLKLTQELVGADDPEMQRGASPEEQMYALLDMFEYFNALTESRRERPTEDLASAIANARIDGEYMSDIDTVSYYVIVATAGHDTTSAAISGGMRALIEHPDQRQRLRDDPSLMPTAAEEMIRWTTPVKGFMRTATEDTVIHDVPIAAGESVLLSYVSANRDEEVFDEPFRFDVSRTPNHHLSFGYGVHFCMGAALARMEIRSLFAELLPRLESVDFDGQPELIATTFVGGHKHLPLRYSLR